MIRSGKNIRSGSSFENQMYSEENRLKTFNSTWPHPFIDPKMLAKTGLYFVEPDDDVKCNICGIDLYRWAKDDT